MTYTPQPVVQDGGQPEIVVGDNELANILHDILRELKVLNLHMQSMTDQKITGDDVEI